MARDHFALALDDGRALHPHELPEAFAGYYGKHFEVLPPAGSELRITIDYDDVPHPIVQAQATALAAMLNAVLTEDIGSLVIAKEAWDRAHSQELYDALINEDDER